jgi:membrane-associated phospholipid phosphatase
VEPPLNGSVYPDLLRFDILCNPVPWRRVCSSLLLSAKENTMQLGSVLLCAGFAVSSTAFGQTSGSGKPTPTASSTGTDRPVSLKRLLPNLISDQKRIWSSPARLVQDRNWIPVAAVLGTTAGLMAIDPVEGGYFRRTSTFQPLNNALPNTGTAAGIILAPVSLYAAGLIRKDSKMQHTALLAGEAVADAELVTTVLKDATRRVRPAAIPPNGNFSDNWFESSGSLLRGSGSFPSGHTIAVVSIATVVARRYGNHRWVRYAAYGAAAAVAFSRLSLSAHFLSDVFMGGALGYSISRFAVLRQ